MARLPVIGPLSTVNERLVSLEIVRQVLLLRFSLHVRDTVVKALNKTEQPVASMIRDMLRTEAGWRNPEQVRKLDALIVQLNAIRQPAWEAAHDTVQERLTELAEAEPEDQRDMFAFLLPGAELLLPVAATLGLGAVTTAFQGRTLRQWFTDTAADDAKRIRQAVYLGTGAGESPGAVARRVVGSAAMGGRDGVTQTSRNHVDTVVRSATVHFSAFARDQFYKANEAARYVRPVPPAEPGKAGATRKPLVRPIGGPEDPAEAEARRQVKQALGAADNAAGEAGKGGTKLFTWEQFVAVLDNRTTKICRGLDGKRFRLGQGPIPPLHMNCRSNRVLVLPEKVGGPIYDPGTYGEWIRRQPFEVQVMLAGSTKANKMRDEPLAESAFQDYGARPMTLRQVREEARKLMASY